MKKVQLPRVGAARGPSGTRSERVHAATLYVLAFTCGGALMSLEIVGSRVLAPWFGTSVYVWGSLIGIFLGALSIGYFLGGKMADRRPQFTFLALISMTAGVLILVICFISALVCGFLVRTGLSDRWGALLGSIALFGLPSIVLGMVSPYAVRLRAQSVSTVGNVAGLLYAVSTLGSIAGTFLTSFLLIQVFGNRWILIGLAGVLIGVSTILLALRAAAQLERMSPVRVGSFIFAGAIMSWLAPSQLYPYETMASGDKLMILEERDSPYQHIVVSEFRHPSDPSQNQRRLQFDDHLQSAIYVDTLNRPVLRSAAKYTDMLFLPLIFDPHPERVLVIGGGGCVVPTIYHQSYPWMTIDVVEIDPVVVDLARKYFGLRTDDRLRVFVEDGRMFLRRPHEKYDLVMLDAYTSAGRIPFHLISREFFEEVRSHLTGRGIVAANIISAMRGRGARFYLAALRTILEVFPEVHVFPKVLDNRFDPAQYNNIVLVILQTSSGLTKEDIVQRAQDLLLKGAITLPSVVHYASWYQPGEQNRSDVRTAPLLTDDHNPADLLATK